MLFICHDDNESIYKLELLARRPQEAKWLIKEVTSSFNILKSIGAT